MSKLQSPAFRRHPDGSVSITSLDPNGQVHLYDLFPGIKVMFIHIRAARWPNEGWGALDEMVSEHTFILNYSVNGSCKIGAGNDRYFIQNRGDVSLSAQFAREDFLYPEGAYDGLEFYIDPAALPQDHPLRTLFGVTPEKIFERYRLRSKTRIALCEEPLRAILDTLWSCYDSGLTGDALSTVRLETARLLRAFQVGADPFADQRRAMFTAVQMHLAEQMEALLTEDLKRTVTLAELSERLGISETSVKHYFKSVYGKTTAAYLRQKRMQRAAELLRGTGVGADDRSGRKLSVLDIALEVGYENQSKFAAAFKREYGESPLDYKRHREPH